MPKWICQLTKSWGDFFGIHAVYSALITFKTKKQFMQILCQLIGLIQRRCEEKEVAFNQHERDLSPRYYKSANLNIRFSEIKWVGPTSAIISGYDPTDDFRFSNPKKWFEVLKKRNLALTIKIIAQTRFILWRQWRSLLFGKGQEFRQKCWARCVEPKRAYLKNGFFR